MNACCINCLRFLYHHSILLVHIRIYKKFCHKPYKNICKLSPLYLTSLYDISMWDWEDIFHEIYVLQRRIFRDDEEKHELSLSSNGIKCWCFSTQQHFINVDEMFVTSITEIPFIVKILQLLFHSKMCIKNSISIILYKKTRTHQNFH